MPIQTSGADTSIYQNIKGFNDYNAAAQQQGLQSALAIAKLQQLQNPNSGMTPAALQIANEYRLARQTGDTDRMKDIELFTKAYDKGLVTGENGIEALQGYGQAAGGIAAQKAGATEAAKLQQQLGYKPSIEQAVATQKNKAELEYAEPIAAQKAQGAAYGKEVGTAAGNKAKQTYNAPELEFNIKKAIELLPKATSGGLQTTGKKVSQYFGQSTEASKADTQLNVVASKLTASVPRFEGPQGVLDVELYKAAAGDLANTSPPAEDRIAAAKLMEDLLKKNKVTSTPQNSDIDAKRQRLEELRAKAGING